MHAHTPFALLGNAAQLSTRFFHLPVECRVFRFKNTDLTFCNPRFFDNLLETGACAIMCPVGTFELEMMTTYSFNCRIMTFSPASSTQLGLFSASLNSFAVPLSKRLTIVSDLPNGLGLRRVHTYSFNSFNWFVCTLSAVRRESTCLRKAVHVMFDCSSDFFTKSSARVLSSFCIRQAMSIHQFRERPPL
jgi:hypothetical protein